MKLRKPGTHWKDGNMKKLFRRNQIIITTLAIMIAAAGYLNYAGKKELEASTDSSVYQSGLLEISDEDLLAENQAGRKDESPSGTESTGENEAMGAAGGQVEEAQPQAEGEQLQAEAAGALPEQEKGQTLAAGGGDSLAEAGGENQNLAAEIESWDEGEESGIENPGEAVLTNGLTVSDYIAGVQMNREQIRAKNKETLNEIISSTAIDEASKQEAIQSMIEMTAIAEKENAAETLLQAKGFADPVVSVTNGKADVVINASSITDQQRAQIEDIVKRKTEVAADGIVITLMKLEE